MQLGIRHRHCRPQACTKHRRIQLRSAKPTKPRREIHVTSRRPKRAGAPTQHCLRWPNGEGQITLPFSFLVFFFIAPRPFGLVTGASLFSLWPGSFVPWSSFVACAALVGRCRCRSACGTGPSRQGILTTRACLIRAGGSGPPILRKIRKCAALDIIWA